MIFSLQTIGADTFVNPRYVTHDPWIIKKDGYYYYCASDGDTNIYVWKSQSLTEKGDWGVVWTAPLPDDVNKGLNSFQVWAPELHYINNKWYIYYAASNGDNATHRMWVLEASTSDPQGSYIDRGKLDTGNYWAIDGTVLDYNNNLYFIWSGWPGTINTNVQNTYIATMSSPTVISGSRVRISQADQSWEKLNPPYYFQEGQEILKNSNGDIFIIYSTNPFWTIDYRLGQLKFTGFLNSQITDPSYWTKKSRPVFQATYDVWGPGHASYTKSKDDTEDWIIYHSQISTANGKRAHRSVQKFTWNQDGSPNFVQPVSGAVPRNLPSGETGNVNGTTFTDNFSDGKVFDQWTFNGSSSTFTVVNGQLKLMQQAYMLQVKRPL